MTTRQVIRYFTRGLGALALVAGCGWGLQAHAASAAPAVVGLWRFNEGTGSVAVDSSGLGNTGTLNGENGNVPARVAGQAGFGGALRFTNDNASHAYVSIPGAGPLMIGQTATNAWSITAWVFEDSNGTGAFVATYGRIIVIEDGEAFQLESGVSGDSQMYTWPGQTPPGRLRGTQPRR